LIRELGSTELVQVIEAERSNSKFHEEKNGAGNEHYDDCIAEVV
jgi:hypothetical protein